MSIASIIDTKLGAHEIISVFCNPEDNYSAAVGFAAAADDDYFVLKNVSTAGTYDGYVLRKKDQIFRVDHKTAYENNLLKLYMHYGQSHVCVEIEGGLLPGFLAFAKRAHLVACIGARDYSGSSVSGFIETIDVENEVVSLHLLNDDGAFDGYVDISFEAIVRMSVDCEKQQRLKVLHQMI